MTTAASPIERNERFELAYKFITETAENIFLTGKAGTGKTTFLKYLKEHCIKNIVVAAPTGVAAINAAGVTLHSLFQLPFHPFIPTAVGRDELLKKMKYNNQRLQLLRKMELLVIDEISMVRSDVIDAIDTLLRSVRRNYSTAFGGVQLLCIGDLHQLPPVAQNHEWSILQEYYESPFFFDSYAIKEQQPILIELNTIYRQKEQRFVDLLNNVRTNNMSEEDFESLHERYIPGFQPYSDDKFITLTSHNNQANLINNTELERLLSPAYTFKAIIEDDFPENQYPADVALVLKKGAQVMFIKNDGPEKKYFNGKIGIVDTLNDDTVIVDCNGERIEVYKEQWENSRYTLNRTDGKLVQEVVGTFRQYPLRLAWAITIHKSQGLTFDKVMIDAGAAFSSGQVYVALSRCTSLEGIVLLSKIPATAIYSNSSVNKGQQSLTHRGSLEERFEGARQLYTQQLLEDMFTFNAVADVLDVLQVQSNIHRAKLNNGALDWITNLRESFAPEKMNGLKFVRQINTLLKEQPVVELNISLQTRITAAVNHFIPKFAAILEAVKKHPIITEFREVADAINEPLNELAQATHLTHYMLQYGLQPFELTSYLQHKLNAVQPKFNLTCYAASQKTTATDVPNPALYETLKQWRDDVCKQEDKPIYMLASHATLKEICALLPTNNRALLLINGFGKAKVDKYGDEIIKAVVDYCDEHQIESPAAALNTTTKTKKTTKPKAAATAKKVDTKQSTFELFQQGKTIIEIATIRQLTVATIEGHITAFIEKGLVDVHQFLQPAHVTAIAAVLNDKAYTSLTEIKAALPTFSYSEIKMAEAAIKFNESKG
ncbi:helix-turn-helix domain-containing protein [Ferruginibacter yonginensis]|uniref:Helix-turn-helix domain-containing protein n=1 Tax=Ferruginibacter yonginensis TaxID=1310416 RepID=A0ABV8QRP4_9BACT